MIIRILKPTLSALLQIVVLVAAVSWILDSGAQAMGYRWQWERVPDYIAFYEDGEWWPAELIEGLFVTIKISLLALIATLLIGLTTALLRNSNSIVGRTIASSYVETYPQHTTASADLSTLLCLWTGTWFRAF